MNRPELLLVLIGFGHVARRFVHLLEAIDDRLDFDCRIVGLATRSHGSVVDPDGIDSSRALAVIEADQSLARLDPHGAERSGIDVLRQVADLMADEASDGRLVAVESTVLDIEGGEPAVSHVRAALEGQLHVVTVNKGPVAFAHHELDTLASHMDRAFLFEGTVMDGVPVFNLVRETMPGVTIHGFRGVLNTTTNFILSEIERGRTSDAAIREMQARGIAEADPSLDVDGWDAAAKVAALVNALMGGTVTPHDVQRTSIAEVTGTDMADAIARGRRIRLVASATRHANAVTARVEPEEIDLRDPLATLDATENALYLRTDLLGEVGIVQRGSDVGQTAYAIVSDLARIAARSREDTAR